MLYYKNLYISNKITRPEYTKWRLEHNAGSFGVYLIVLPPDPLRIPGPFDNQLEFMHNAFLHQSYYDDNPPYIVGIAEGRFDAITMAARIVSEAQKSLGRPDVYAYLFPGGDVESYFTGTAKHRRKRTLLDRFLGRNKKYENKAEKKEGLHYRVVDSGVISTEGFEETADNEKTEDTEDSV